MELDAIGRDMEVRRLSWMADNAGSPLTETGAALGCTYPLGAGELRPTLGALVALNWIESPLLEGAESLSPQDIIRALYCVGVGAAAVRPMHGLQVRLRLMESAHDALVAAGPAGEVAWCEMVDRISAPAWAEFDAAACRFAEQFGPVSPHNMFAVIGLALQDGNAAVAALGNKGVDTSAEKKTVTPIGWGRFCAWFRSICRNARRMKSLIVFLWRELRQFWRRMPA